MDKITAAANMEVKALGGGLVLRSVQPEDVDRSADFFVRVFAEDEGIQPDERIGHWVRDLFRLDDDPDRRRYGFLVEKEDSRDIVSALLAIPQTWTYAGIPILAGRPEPVATDKAFRNRGLVRALFQEFHHASEKDGDLMQVISGIPWFYRQFGYEMAVELGGSRSGFITQVEAAEKEKNAEIKARAAVEKDISFLCKIYANSAVRYLLHCPLDLDWWEKEIVHKHPANIEKTGVFILEKTDGSQLGFFIVSKELSDGGVFLRYLEIKPGENWRSCMPSVITESWKFGERIAKETDGSFSRLIFGLGSQHPAYQAAADFLPMQRRPYNWYLRVPQLAKFIAHVSPVLENNLASSPFAGFDGTLKISFYKRELHLTFKNGNLSAAVDAAAGRWQDADLCFPDLTFLQLMFGYRSGSELLNMFVDCRIPEKFLPLIDVIFPKKLSLILPVE
jgi:hypothetical protein